jgi:signal transduction histidine kinase
VARHAGARQTRIRLALERGEATLTVADDGRGVTAEELARPTSLGLAGMRERAIAAGGQVTVTGAAGRGTTVSVRVPLADGHLR